jgi:GrpB-like predicted nucleotidyltransferase (UPF0157 family)
MVTPQRLPLGLESGTVTVVPYDERWVRLFEEAADELRNALGPRITNIHHVGSTAVSGLAAKPVLDILVTIPDFERARGLAPLLANLGYEYRPQEEIPDRHYFRRLRGTTRTHHLSLAESTSHYHRATIAFRDALRRDHTLADAYAALKHELAAQFPRDRQSYLEGKTAFVQSVLAVIALRSEA